MRRIGTALASAALIALTACGGDGDPAATPTTPAPVVSTPAPSGGSPTPSGPSLPPGCQAPAAAPAGATVITATVSGGKVTTERRRYDVARGGTVRVLVTSDVADEVHVHGYDLRAALAPGCPTALDFPARIPGSVEVELERGHLELFEIRAG